MGQIFMNPPMDCPFKCFDDEYAVLRQKTKIILLDIHAEATSEKIAMAWHVDGKVSAVVGTHTHVQTGDERIFPQGTGYLTDAGMNGPVNSVIGMRTDIILKRFRTKRPARMEVAEGPCQINGVVFSIDTDSGKCQNVTRVRKMPNE